MIFGMKKKKNVDTFRGALDEAERFRSDYNKLHIKHLNQHVVSRHIARGENIFRTCRDARMPTTCSIS